MLKKIGIFLSGLLLVRCNDSSLADYYTYLEVVKGQPKAGEVDQSKISVNCHIAENFKIADKNKTENILLRVSFNGLHQVFPEDLTFEFYVDDKKFQLPDSINYSITTAIDNSLKRFSITESSLNIKQILSAVKTQNNIPDSISYFTVSGLYYNFPLNNSSNPEKLKLKVRALSKGQVIAERERTYELKRPRLYKTRSRPFG